MSKPLHLLEERIPSPIGQIVLLSDAAGAVRALDFADYGPRMRRLLDAHYGPLGWHLELSPTRSQSGQAIERYFEGDFEVLTGVKTETAGTPFQRAVWTSLRALRSGETCSYAALASAIGRPKAVRAVGSANGANPIAIIVPCHRVIGSSGALTGYGGGIGRKQWLLAHEAQTLNQARRT